MGGSDRGTKLLGLHDGQIKSYVRSGTTLQVSVVTWQESEISILFDGVIAMVDTAATDADLEQLQECARTAALSSLLENQLETLVSLMQYSRTEIDRTRRFQFLSLDDMPLLDIICESFRVAS